MTNLSNIGEFGLINIIKSYIKIHPHLTGIGDDCAVIPINNEEEMLVTTDTLVENVHFLENTNPFKLGRKSLAINISDIAACSGKPKWAFLTLCLRNNIEFEYIDLFIKGFLNMADEYSVELLGGDITRTETFTISVTVIGINKLNKSIKRSGAQIGDDVYVTGQIGCSYAGLTALRKGKTKNNEHLIEKHINPVPRVEFSKRISNFSTSMIDISDGLLQDCSHICESSNVGIELYFESIPFCKTNIASKEEMLSGGEDYELVFSANKKYRPQLNTMAFVTLIGTITNGNGVRIIKNNKLLYLKKLGFKHF